MGAFPLAPIYPIFILLSSDEGVTTNEESNISALAYSKMFIPTKYFFISDMKKHEKPKKPVHAEHLEKS